MRPPASLYAPSPQAYPPRLPALEYPGHYEVRRVSRNGGIRWHKQWVNVSQTLGEESVGFVEIDDGEWDVYFGPLRLGRFHERTLLIEDALGRQYRRPY
jgi:putative transposase